MKIPVYCSVVLCINMNEHIVRYFCKRINIYIYGCYSVSLSSSNGVILSECFLARLPNLSLNKRGGGCLRDRMVVFLGSKNPLQIASESK